MFDRIALKKKIDMSVAEQLAERNKLDICTCAGEIYYQSSNYGNFDSLFITIKGGKIEIKCSLHKWYNKYQGGALDNSTRFAMRNASAAIHALLDTIGITIDNLKVTYYEIALNLVMSDDPLHYIERAQSFAWANDREMFNDANYEKNRQKTTEKSRHIKKVLKIYDKTFECAQKKRTIQSNVLRCETIYRRQSIDAATLFSDAYLVKLQERFYNDWRGLEFTRHIEADAGVKGSQIERAKEILANGVEAYLNENKQLYTERRITKKQWETIRTFAQNWSEEKKRYRMIAGAHEQEFNELFLTEYQAVML